MKKVLLFSSLAPLLVPLAARAEGETDRPATVVVEGSVATNYIFPKQAIVVSRNPVVNATVTWNQSTDFSGYVWGQIGDYDAVEVDVGESFSHTLANGVNVHSEAAIYLYPNGSSIPVGTVAVGVSVPLGHGFIASADAQVYRGGFDSEFYSVDVSHAVGVATVTIGHAWNPRQRLEPTYAMVSVPLGHSERPVTIGFSGFIGAGHGFGVSASRRFW